jgi:mono/diheme cytochrome c family protein
MKINFPTSVSVLIFILISVPTFLRAQSSRQGNHCGVQKSPYRLSMDSGKVVYTKRCLSCHQADGLGTSNINPPLVCKSVTGDKKNLIEIVIKGQVNHQEINGKTYQNTMPPNPDIKDQEIADVLTYIRNSFGNKAPAVKVSEVKSARSD